MIQNLKHESYNDGILKYGNIKSKYTEGRRKIGEEFIPKGQLFYTEMSSRDTDILQASSMGYVIDLKLKVPYRPNISSKDKVQINDNIYDIKKFDSAKKKEIYLYLQKVGV
ncbi:phage head closure protein [Anaerosalibacter massiliensis]|uniref:phage head closure protein n=1 Tax=Anaerosalibacter massiliensis TaxID=1347392 RepID=UPI0005B26F31|nr:phage head closure protein [Anaerosalibacter massiliensis]